MTTLSPDQYLLAQERTVRLAIGFLLAFWGRIEHLKALDKRKALEEYWPTIVNRYGDVAATLAASRFEEITGKPAVLAPPLTEDYANSRMRWAVSPLFGGAGDGAAIGLLNGLLDEFVFTAARETTNTSATTHHARVARVPNPGACSWCIMLGSRGFDYARKESALSAGHTDCRCRIAVEGEDVRDYDPDALFGLVEAGRQAAGSGDPKKILAAMRANGGVSDALKPRA